MATKQKKVSSRTIPQILVDTFFGSFRRVLGTCGLVFILFAVFFPDLATLAMARALNAIAEALMPFAGFIGGMAVLALGLWIIVWKGLLGK